MTRTIFVNLPVTNLPNAMRFYEAIGFTNEPRFTDDSAAAMRWSDAIFVMLLTHDRWYTFTDRPIAAPGSSEVALCIGCADRAEVNRIADSAGAAGGTVDINPSQDHGFMMSRSIGDPDGHVWEPMWMDPDVASGAAELPPAGSTTVGSTPATTVQVAA